MVGADVLALDLLETALYFAAPALLWLFLFALAYREGPLARAGGFDRKTFWLLVPAALLAEFANLLFFGFGDDLLAINVGGGLIPLLLSIWLMARVLPEPRRSLAEWLAALALATGLALAIVELDLPGTVGQLGPGVAALLPGAALAIHALAAGTEGRRRRLFVAEATLLFGLAVLLTQLTTAAIPGLGIVSVFPAYLIAPVALGALAALVTRNRMGRSFGPALAVAYATVTLGVLVGADVLHQPPLYGGGGAALYSIGGAGLLDLLHLSGLLALVGAYGTIRALRRRPAEPTDDPGPTSPSRRIRRGWYRYLDGQYPAAVDDSLRSVRDAVADARRLHGLGEASPESSWAGLPGVPPWVAVDGANLEAVAPRAGASSRETYRAWLTAKALVQVASTVAARRRATGRDRAFAFAIDLAILAVGMVAVDVALLPTLHGSLGALLNGLTFNAAINGAIGWGLAYFLLFEGRTGTTPGKRMLGLAVTDRQGAPPPFREVWIRNVPRVVPVSLVAYSAAMVVLDLSHPVAVGGPVGLANLLGELIAVTAIGFGLTGVLALLTIAATDEQQRLGDLVAGTWVVRVGPIRGLRRVRRAAGVPAAGSSPPAAG